MNGIKSSVSSHGQESTQEDVNSSSDNIFSVGIGDKFLKIKAPSVTSAVYFYASITNDGAFLVELSKYKIKDRSGVHIENPFVSRPFTPVYYSTDEFIKILKESHNCENIGEEEDPDAPYKQFVTPLISTKPDPNCGKIGEE